MNDHYCIISKNGIKQFYSKNKIVSRKLFFELYPLFDEKKCLLSQEKNKLDRNLGIIKQIERDLNYELEFYKSKLEECNSNLQILEEDLIKKMEQQLENTKDRNLIFRLKNEVSKNLDQIKLYKADKELTVKKMEELSSRHKTLLKDLDISREKYIETLENLNEKKDIIKQLLISDKDLKHQLDECITYNKGFRQELIKLLEIQKEIQSDDDLKLEISQQIEKLNSMLKLSEIHKQQLETIINKKDEEIKLIKNKEIENTQLTQNLIIARDQIKKLKKEIKDTYDTLGIEYKE
jgi:chromosome segregation ATPase